MKKIVAIIAVFVLGLALGVFAAPWLKIAPSSKLINQVAAPEKDNLSERHGVVGTVIKLDRNIVYFKTRIAWGESMLVVNKEAAVSDSTEIYALAPKAANAEAIKKITDLKKQLQQAMASKNSALASKIKLEFEKVVSGNNYGDLEKQVLKISDLKAGDIIEITTDDDFNADARVRAAKIAVRR